MRVLSTVSGIAQAAGGELLCGGLGCRPVNGVAIDTRSMPVGGVFFALKGETRDGHHFVRHAAGRGAAAVVVSDLDEIRPFPEGLAVILVQDVVEALSQVARWYRTQLEARVVAVTGTAGKSTTKQLLAAILSAAGSTSASPGSFNNHLGVPLSMLMARRSTKYLVLEMGTSNPGEISSLSLLARPDMAIITNVGPGHLEGLGDLDGVARAKREILDGLSEDGPVVLSADDSHSRHLASERKAGRPVHTFGKVGELSVVRKLRTQSGLVIETNDSARWRLGLQGGPAVHSALAAITAARVLGLDDETISRGLTRYVPLEMRLETFQLEGGVTLLNDVYNANPLSVGAAVDYLVELAGSRRKVVVLGEMLELGKERLQWHEAVGRRTAHLVDLVWAVGQSARQTAVGACGISKTRISKNTAEVVSRIAEVVRDGDVVLIKGSRGMKMEQVSASLIEDRKVVQFSKERSDEVDALSSPHTAAI